MVEYSHLNEKSYKIVKDTLTGNVQYLYQENYKIKFVHKRNIWKETPYSWRRKTMKRKDISIFQYILYYTKDSFAISTLKDLINKIYFIAFILLDLDPIK